MARRGLALFMILVAAPSVAAERGYTISMDTAHFVHQVATSQSNHISYDGGSVYWIPQFTLVGNSLVDHYDASDLQSRVENTVRTNLTIHDMIEARRSHTLLNLKSIETQMFDCSDSEYDDGMQKQKRNNLLENLDALWWYGTEKIVNSTSYHNEDEEDRKIPISSIQQSMVELSLPENYNLVRNLDISPILLLDNHGPYGGGSIRTNEIVREVEEFVGEHCYNVLKMTQLAILGYKWDVLDGAFAISSWGGTTDRSNNKNDNDNNKIHGVRSNERCPKCLITKDSLLKSIYNSEIRRVAQTAILWNEYYNQYDDHITLSE